MPKYHIREHGTVAVVQKATVWADNEEHARELYEQDEVENWGSAEYINWDTYQQDKSGDWPTEITEETS